MKPEFLEMTQNYACCNGMLLKSKGDPNAKVVPYTTHPSRVSRTSFEKLKKLQPLMNHFRDQVSRDFDFIKGHMTE